MIPNSFKPFEQMTSDDYAAIGFRAGLEVHRQLLTKTKLFCRCPAGRYSDEFDAEILRHMRPTLSELGEYDGTALMEKKTRKNIYYRIHRDTVCTYEFDDTPPFFPAEDALEAAIELSLLLRLNMVGEFHIARKQYLDGSIPAGFQRTTILGVDGWIPYQDRRIGIRQLGLEEDSCREVSDTGHDRIYSTDRLGMPLIEVVTEPQLYTPREVEEVGEIIRRLCRSTGKVRTGYGAVRQDVNVSVKGGTRIEIKGVPQLGRIPRLVYNEARRQCSLLAIRDELLSRGVEPDSVVSGVRNVTGIVAKTRYEPMAAALKSGSVVKCIALRGFAGLLNTPTQENTTFAKEFSDRIRVIACLTRLPNMVHSDTASESLFGRDWQKIGKKMNAGEQDALILVWGDEADTQTACQEIGIRAREATIGIPSDTRQALKDGTNGFERVLPGAERMYPDTDLPPMEIPQTQVQAIQDALPEFIWDREARYRVLGLSEAMIRDLVYSEQSARFDRAVSSYSIDSKFAVVVLCERFKAFGREGLPVADLADDDILPLFQAFSKGLLVRDGIYCALRQLLKSRKDDPGFVIEGDDVVGALGLTPVDLDAVRSQVSKIVESIDHANFPTLEVEHRFIMGRLMADLRGRVDGGELAKMVSGALQSDGCTRTTDRHKVQ